MYMLMIRYYDDDNEEQLEIERSLSKKEARKMKECYERETEKLKNIIPDFYCLDNIEIQKEPPLSAPPLLILLIILCIPLSIFVTLCEDNSGITEKKEYVLDAQSYQTQYMKLEKNKTYEIKLISAFYIEERFAKLVLVFEYNGMSKYTKIRLDTYNKKSVESAYNISQLELGKNYKITMSKDTVAVLEAD